MCRRVWIRFWTRETDEANCQARVDQIIHMKRELVQLAGEFDLGWLDDDRSLDVSSAGCRAFWIWLRSEGRPAIEGSRQGGAGGNRAIKRAAVGATAET